MRKAPDYLSSYTTRLYRFGRFRISMCQGLAYSDANEVDEVDFESESQVAGQILIIIRLTTTAAVESKK